jgi:DNA-directed RNA polymerase subunit alpha
VDEMDFSVRIYNALNSEKILYVWQLAEKTERDLLRMKNLGRKSVGEIQQVLKGLGLSLGMQITPALLG